MDTTQQIYRVELPQQPSSTWSNVSSRQAISTARETPHPRPVDPRGSLLSMARRIAVRCARFSDGVVLEDLEAALSDPDFDGLRGKSWGMLLSHGFIDRYVAAVNRRAESRFLPSAE